MRHDKNNELLSDAIQIVYVELSKLHEIMKKSVYDMTDLEKWAIFFQYANEPTYRDTVNKVIESKEALKMAGNLLMSISQDERERAVFRSRKMYQTDRESDLATVEDRGKKIGKEIGRLERNTEIAQNMLSEGLSFDTIMRCTGLTRHEIENLPKTV